MDTSDRGTMSLEISESEPWRFHGLAEEPDTRYPIRRFEVAVNVPVSFVLAPYAYTISFKVDKQKETARNIEQTILQGLRPILQRLRFTCSGISSYDGLPLVEDILVRLHGCELKIAVRNRLDEPYTSSVSSAKAPEDSSSRDASRLSSSQMQRPESVHSGDARAGGPEVVKDMFIPANTATGVVQISRTERLRPSTLGRRNNGKDDKRGNHPGHREISSKVQKPVARRPAKGKLPPQSAGSPHGTIVVAH